MLDKTLYCGQFQVDETEVSLAKECHRVIINIAGIITVFMVVTS